ncbi:MAG: mini-circle protein [Ilumatobacteraceae bacterium]|nr:mini-circle protein [Ilumatobacteraceae bacterium]
MWHLCGTRSPRPPKAVAAEASPQTERAGLFEFLGYKRDALIAALDGLSEAEARACPTASALSLLSLVKHSAIWERRWFQVIVAGRSVPGEWPDAPPAEQNSTFRLTDTDTIASVVADYREQIAASNEILATFDLEAPCAWPDMAAQNLRWVALHLIEETAQHVGHADIIRETIDGRRSS